MGDNDPLAKAEALLARYRTVAESDALLADFPVLTEIVEPSLKSPENAAQSIDDVTSSHKLESPTKLESGDSAARLIHPMQSQLGASFTHDLAKDLVARIRPAIDEFTNRIACEIAAAVGQEVSRLLSEGIATQTAGKAEEDQGPAGPAAG